MSERDIIRRLKLPILRIYALFLAQFKTGISYPWHFTFYIINTLIGAASYSYLGNAVIYSGSLSQYGNISYFAYLIVGMAFFTYLHQSLNAAQNIINPWTLEHQLITPVSLPVLLIGSSIWAYIQNSITIVTYLGVGVIFFSLEFNINATSTFLTIILGLLIMWGLGMMAAGFQIVTKKWNPVTWAFSVLSMLVGGVYFPPNILPNPLKTVSVIMPQYYILDLLRKAMLCGFTPAQLKLSLLKLAISALIVFPFGYICLKRGIEKARKEGTLGHF